MVNAVKGLFISCHVPMAQFIVNLNTSMPASERFIVHILDPTHMFIQPHMGEYIRSKIASSETRTATRSQLKICWSSFLLAAILHRTCVVIDGFCTCPLLVGGETMAQVEVLVNLYRQRGIQVLVLLSFALQVILLVTAEIRRRKDSGVLRAVIWSAYLMADSTAIYALGHMSVMSSSPEHQLMAFWAPFLLIHLGGQDNITAFTVEDNRLWLRHLQALAVQVVMAAYVLCESSFVGSPTLLWNAAILMFVVGAVKYGERVWALKSATASNNPMNTYRGMKVYQSAVPVYNLGRRDTEHHLRTAHKLLNFPKDLLEMPYGQEHEATFDYCWQEAPEKLFMFVEMQVSLMHDLLYTKAVVMHTWSGLCIHIFSWVSTAAALLLFYLSCQADKRHGYNKAAVAVTYALLVGAIILETTSLVRSNFSTWALAGFKYSRLSRTWRLYVVQPLLPLLLEKRRWWSHSIGQHNLFELFDRRRTSRCSRIARWIGVEDPGNTMVHSWRICVTPKMKQLLVKLLFRLREEGRDKNSSPYLRSVPPGWEDNGMKLEDSILVWHIATNIYLRWYKDQEQANDHELMETIEALSNYMLFLLVARPYMLPDFPSRRGYVGLCHDLGVASDISTEAFVRSLQACGGSAQNKGVPSHSSLLHKPQSGPLCNITLCRGSQLGVKLIGEGLVGTPFDQSIKEVPYSPDSADFLALLLDDSLDPNQEFEFDNSLELIALVWARMLFDAGSRCGSYPHAKQLSDGGELLMVAALMLKHSHANSSWCNFR